MKQLLVLILCFYSLSLLTAQELSKDAYMAFKGDNVSALQSHLNTNQINACYEVNEATYTLLAVSVKMNASKCLSHLISQKNIDLNKTCGGKTAAQYTAKYGNLEMLKQLQEAGADFSNKINGRSVLDYAKKYKQKEIINYLSKV